MNKGCIEASSFSDLSGQSYNERLLAQGEYAN